MGMGMGRLAPLRTGVTLPLGVMVAAGVVCVFVPLTGLIAYNLSFADPNREMPSQAEMFVFFGWLPGLIALPVALFAAHRLNARGINGWLASPLAGAVIGALVGLVWSKGQYPAFVAYAAALGTAYGASYWALSHGMDKLLGLMRR